MNKIKRIALVTAITSAPLLAQAELKPMDDSFMSDISGQSGITLELGAHIEIDAIKYTDEGSLAIKNVAIGGADIWDGSNVNANSNLDDLTFDIDVNAAGELIVDMTSTGVDYGVTISGMELQKSDGTSTSTLLGRTTVTGKINNLDFTVHKEDKMIAGTSTNIDVLQANIEFNIQDMDLDIKFLGLKLENVSVSGTGAGTDDYVSAQFDLYEDSGKMVVELADVSMDMNIGAIRFGSAAASMGSLEFDNMRITNTTLKFSAHD